MLVGVGTLVLTLALNPPLFATVRQSEGVGQNVVGPITNDTPMRQVFRSRGDSLGGVGLVMATGGLGPSDKVRISVVELGSAVKNGSSRGNPVVTTTLSASEIGDWALTAVRFGPRRIKPGVLYAIDVVAGPKGGVYVAATKEDAYREGALYVAGKRQPGDAAFRVYRAPSSLNPVEGVAEKERFKPLLGEAYLLALLVINFVLIGMVVASSILFGRHQASISG